MAAGKGHAMIDKIAPYWKAVVGFLAPAAVLVIAAVQPGSDGGTAITAAEWITAACTCVATSAGVYTVPNKRTN